MDLLQGRKGGGLTLLLLCHWWTQGQICLYLVQVNRLKSGTAEEDHLAWLTATFKSTTPENLTAFSFVALHRFVSYTLPNYTQGKRRVSIRRFFLILFWGGEISVSCALLYFLGGKCIALSYRWNETSDWKVCIDRHLQGFFVKWIIKC